MSVCLLTADQDVINVAFIGMDVLFHTAAYLLLQCQRRGVAFLHAKN